MYYQNLRIMAKALYDHRLITRMTIIIGMIKLRKYHINNQMESVSSSKKNKVQKCTVCKLNIRVIDGSVEVNENFMIYEKVQNIQ